MAGFWPVPKPAVATTIAILESRFAGMYVRSLPPAERPERYIVVSLVNTDYDNPAFTVPRPVVDCWALTPGDAEAFAGEAVAALKNAKAHTFNEAFITGVRDVQGPYPLPHPDVHDRHRYQFHGGLYISTR